MDPATLAPRGNYPSDRRVWLLQKLQSRELVSVAEARISATANRIVAYAIALISTSRVSRGNGMRRKANW